MTSTWSGFRRWRRWFLSSARAPAGAPRLRGVLEGLPFTLDAATLRSGLNFTLSTDEGDVDLLGEVAGLGTYAQVSQRATEVAVDGGAFLVLDLDGLEASKRAAGRPKDLLDLGAIHELKKLGSGSDS